MLGYCLHSCPPFSCSLSCAASCCCLAVAAASKSARRLLLATVMACLTSARMLCSCLVKLSSNAWTAEEADCSFSCSSNRQTGRTIKIVLRSLHCELLATGSQGLLPQVERPSAQQPGVRSEADWCAQTCGPLGKSSPPMLLLLLHACAINPETRAKLWSETTLLVGAPHYRL